jgi:hypothetical protein
MWLLTIASTASALSIAIALRLAAVALLLVLLPSQCVASPISVYCKLLVQARV